MRSWLVGEGEKRGHSIILDEWTDVNGHGPLQDNTNDCGVFASQVGNSLAVGENLWFCQVRPYLCVCVCVNSLFLCFICCC
eukprot:m.208317 g.208317  ORF g.208317 m.208317 type:complete len:81 (-) comp13764_c1_seq5:336-578(-)